MHRSSFLVRLSPLGLIAERRRKVVKTHRFAETVENCVEVYLGLERGIIDRETYRFLETLASENRIRTLSPILADFLKRRSFAVELVAPKRGSKRMERLLVEAGFVGDEEEGLETLHRVLILIASRKVKLDLEEKDKLIIHAVEALEECTETINIFYERLREWYGVHFPELERHVQKLETYVNLVAKLKTRESFLSDILTSTGIDKARAEKIDEASKRSFGADLDEVDILQMQEHATCLVDIIKRRDTLERYVEGMLKDHAPNLTYLIGFKLAGKLISKAGGLKRLGMLPSTTIQLLGAEKALFRALRRGAKPPKHGVIFQHPEVNQAPRWIRGKIARALATKITIATRIDAFGGESRMEELKRKFEDRVEEIKRKYPKPVKKIRRKMKRERRTSR